ncbi:MAG: pectinesterase family protein [Chitinophagaceae bacterium]
MPAISTRSFSIVRKCLLRCTAVVTACLLLQTAGAQQLAFPTAEGAGRFTSGGRGTAASPTTVFEVTSLSDDNVPGTLRYAVSASATTYPYRTVVFRISGTIHLTSKLNIRSNTTIAGQTAPGGGICLADNPVVISGDNVILRYIRVRMGDKNQNKGMVDGSGGDDALGNLGGKNIIIDHCSVSWSSDEALTVYRGDSVTMQWNIVSEPLNYSYHFETGDTDFERHGYGGIWGGKTASFHHNLIAHFKGRGPRFAGVSTYSPAVIGAENADFRNNVIYNWGSYSTNGGDGGNYNVVNNYYKYGPATSTGSSDGIPIKTMIMNPSKSTDYPYPKVYLTGNYVDGYPAVTANNWSGVAMAGGAPADTIQSKVTTPFNISTFSSYTAQEAYEQVLLNAGALLPSRDTLDQRIIADVRNRTGNLIDVQGGFPHGTAYELTVNAWPTLASTTPPTDTDHDGMPDTWETANGLNPNDASDRGTFAANGYTNLENYLNSLVTDNPVIGVTASLVSFAQTLGTPSPVQTYTISGTGLAGNIVITPPAGYEISANGGTTWYTSSSPLTLTQSGGTVTSTTITVRLNATTGGTYGGNITHTSTNALTYALPVNGAATTPTTGATVLLQKWPLITDAGDDAASRSAGVTASTPTMNKFYVSNGTTVAGVTAYSSALGQAFSAGPLGDGLWTSATPGPGGTLNRTFYEQFTVTAAAGYSVRVDSISVMAAFYASASNTKLAVVYSKTGFTTADSVDVTAASFASPVVLAQQNTGPTTTYTLALDGTNGVTLAAGQTLTLRLYFSCGSTSSGRYALLKNVWVNGVATGAPAATPAITTTGTLSSFTQTTGSPSAIQTYTVAGSNLTGNVTVTPPANYEVSANGGTNWYTNASPLTLTPASGALANTTISVRLNATAAGTYSGNIAHASPGATAVNVAVSGTATAPNPVTQPPAGTAVTVAKDGSGNYTTIQAAIDAAPTGRTTPYIIFIKNGKYKEKIVIPATKPFIQLVGESVANTIITYNDGASTPTSSGGTVGTFNSYTLYVLANDFSALNITFENSFGDGSQAVAVHVSGDRSAFRNCRFLGNQDTLLTNGNTGLKQYFKNCYIDGNVDFIFGSARAIFDSCVIYAKTRSAAGSSYITAPNTQAGQTYGYVFRNCVFPANIGSTTYYLSRPWQNSTGSSPFANNKVVLLNAVYGAGLIRSEGWSTWDAGTLTNLIYNAEYKSRGFNGSLVDVSQRVSWSYQLTDAEAATYTDGNLFETWTPCSVSADFCTPFTPSIAVSNFRGTKGTTTSTFNWNISWPMAQVTYEVFRSSDKISFTKVSEQVSPNDTAVNYNYSEAIPPPGSTYYYYVRASKAGLAAHITDTVAISSTPTITTTGTLNSFIQGVGLPSATQIYVVAGENLPAAVTITPPAGYEISANGGTNWYSSTTPLTLTPSGGILASTTITVRLNATSAGTFAGNIVHASTGAATVNVAVTGTVQSTPLPVSNVLLYWPLQANNTDDAASRATGVNSSTPSFKNLYLSNGTTVTTVPAYSTTFGQAFGATANGDGTWATTSGGPGGNLSRIYYEEFTLTAQAGYNVRVDSLLLTSSFYNTSSNTKLAVVYSLSGFTTADSLDITGGTGPGGPLVSTANGAFATPILINNQTANTTDGYRLALAASNGVTVPGGKTLTIRLYYSCGSGSAGRYAKLKDVSLKGLASVVQPPAITVAGTLSAFSQTIGTPSAVQTYTVSGSNLTNNIVITPPAGYEISNNGGTNWYTNAAPLTLTQTNGVVNSTTISIRLNATAAASYSGNIANVSTGATTVNVAVTGTTVLAPVVTVTGTLSAFAQTVGSPSAVQTYTVSGANLLANLVITAPANFEISSNGGTSWNNSATPITLTATNGAVSNTTISVRLNATTAATQGGNITNTSGSITVNVAVTGTSVLAPFLTATAALKDFSQTVGIPSASQSFTLNGGNILSNVTVAAPAKFQLSADNGTTWSDTVRLVPATGGVVTRTVLVRMNAASAGNYSGAITASGSGLANISIPVKGVAYSVFTVNPNPAHDRVILYHPQLYTVGTIIVYNANGIKLATWYTKPASNSTSISVIGLPKGMYYLEFRRLGEKQIVPFIKM